MNRRSALSIISSLPGVLFFAQQIPPSTSILWVNPAHNKSIAKLWHGTSCKDLSASECKESPARLEILLDNLPTIEVTFEGKKKTITAKELFEAL